MDSAGDLVIDVACGTAGIYSKRVKLTAEQVRDYEERGPDALQPLARQIWRHEYVHVHDGPIRWWQFWRWMSPQEPPYDPWGPNEYLDIHEPVGWGRFRQRSTAVCSELIERLGSTWGILGWVFFAGWFLGPYFAGSLAAMWAVFLGFFALTLLWWIVDLIDQQPPVWMILVGIMMLGISFLPMGALLRIAAWIIYWTRVRE